MLVYLIIHAIFIYSYSVYKRAATDIEGEVGAVNILKPRPHQQFITDRSKAVGLLWFSVACFWCQSSVTFHLTCVHIISVRFGLLIGHLL